MTAFGSASPVVVGLDMGETGVDVFAIDRATGETTVVHHARGDDPVQGVVAALRACVPDLSSIGSMVLGTRAGTEAILEGRLARTGIITTTGFADILDAPRPEHPMADPVVSPVPRTLRRETPERTLAYGAVDRKVDTLGVLEAAQDFLGARAEAVTVMFLNAPVNPHNERVAIDALRAIWPNPHVTSAVELTPEIPEYERFSTAALNAGLQPVMSRFLGAVERALNEAGAHPRILVMQANGGATTLDTARRHPVRTVRAGASAGALAAARIGAAAELPDLIACSIGRTASEVAMVADGEVLATDRIVLGGGVIRQPTTAVATIGTGGWSTIGLDAGGRPRIGPDTAMPAALGEGERPTIIDAELVLGRIDPEGTSLDAEAAERALLAQIGDPLGLNAAEAAEAVMRLAAAEIAGAIRQAAIGLGREPEGGAGVFHGEGAGRHAVELMRELGLAKAIIPLHPGATSALGCALADVRSDDVRSLNLPVDELDHDRLAEELAVAGDAAEATVRGSGISFERIDRICSVDIVQAGRRRSVRLADGQPTREALAENLVPGIAAVVVRRHVAAIGRRGIDPGMFAAPLDRPSAEPRTRTRRIFAAGEWHEAPVHERRMLAAGTEIGGPALIEQRDATAVFLGPGHRVTVDASKNLILS